MLEVPKFRKSDNPNGPYIQSIIFSHESDGETIVTGAGDETLRFWNVFPKKEETKEK